ncbi:ankyrin repeat, SAM and basic leucine zipper domain-containing protein 1-like [Euwallacea similis]|uniref:ankyrin repeat, SAM and basic leucine zipper domain-containing protein 1-like n=1 Tax=Euwallacea similis TaxID=1736056 RepID=UPI003450D829
MAHGPDWSDSEDSLLADDEDYMNFKMKIKYSQNHACINDTTISNQLEKENEKISFLNAITAGDIENVKELISKGIDLHMVIRENWTAIMLSVSLGNPLITKLLLENGANVHQDRDGITPLMMACTCPSYTAPNKNSLEVVKLLVEKGAVVTVVNRKKMDALMYAASNGNLLVVEYLLPKANKEAVDNQRWNALTWAVSNNQSEVVKFLYDNGFSYNLLDVRGNTALDIAKDNCLDDIVNIFPKKETDLVEEILSRCHLNFEKNFTGLKQGEKPIFFEDLCNFLFSVKCSHLIPLFLDKKLTLDQFLSSDEYDLKNLGVLMPYQRNRILSGLHRFHKQPYLPKSLHIRLKSKSYSNVDIATQVLSAIKQIISMETCLKYLMKHLSKDKLSSEDQKIMESSVTEIKFKIHQMKPVIKKLRDRLQQCDKSVVPVDLIKKDSIRDVNIKKNFALKKLCLGFSLGVVWVLLICKLKS